MVWTTEMIPAALKQSRDLRAEVSQANSSNQSSRARVEARVQEIHTNMQFDEKQQVKKFKSRLFECDGSVQRAIWQNLNMTSISPGNIAVKIHCLLVVLRHPSSPGSRSSIPLVLHSLGSTFHLSYVPSVLCSQGLLFPGPLKFWLLCFQGSFVFRVLGSQVLNSRCPAFSWEHKNLHLLSLGALCSQASAFPWFLKGPTWVPFSGSYILWVLSSQVLHLDVLCFQVLLLPGFSVPSVLYPQVLRFPG